MRDLDSDNDGDAMANREIDINERTSLLRPNGNEEVEVTTNYGISWYFAVFLIVNAALGAGLLNFAKAFDNAGGILVSTVIHLVGLTILFLSYLLDNN